MRVVDFPDDWAIQGKPVRQDAWKPTGSDDIVVVGVLTNDGTGLWAIIFKGGAWFRRVLTTAIGSTVEERAEGEPLPDEREAVERAWRTLREADERAALVADTLGKRLN